MIERPLRVLVVDSNAVSADIMLRYFESWRIEAEARATAAEAEAAWRAGSATRHPFDVVLIDVKGLGYDGVKLAAKIRGTPGARTEVILLVGLDGSVADASVEKVGAYALLTKPARP